MLYLPLSPLSIRYFSPCKHLLGLLLVPLLVLGGWTMAQAQQPRRAKIPPFRTWNEKGKRVVAKLEAHQRLAYGAKPGWSQKQKAPVKPYRFPSQMTKGKPYRTFTSNPNMRARFSPSSFPGPRRYAANHSVRFGPVRNSQVRIFVDDPDAPPLANISNKCYPVYRPRHSNLSNKCYTGFTARRSDIASLKGRPVGSRLQTLMQTSCYSSYKICRMRHDDFRCGQPTICHRPVEEYSGYCYGNDHGPSNLEKIGYQLKIWFTNHRKHCKLSNLPSGVSAGVMVRTNEWGKAIVVDFKIGVKTYHFTTYHLRDSSKVVSRKKKVKNISQIVVLALDEKKPRNAYGEPRFKRHVLSPAETKQIMVENLVRKNHLRSLVQMYPEERQNLLALVMRYRYGMKYDINMKPEDAAPPPPAPAPGAPGSP